MTIYIFKVCSFIEWLINGLYTGKPLHEKTAELGKMPTEPRKKCLRMTPTILGF